MLQIAFGQSKYYVDNLSENIKRGHRAKLRKGIWPGFAPLGYLNNHRTKEIDIDEEKAPLISSKKLLNYTQPSSTHSNR
jgi:DNA invertase Pin-like site-specific DNA recombinase